MLFSCKRILSNKYVLANILKVCAPEFHNCSIQEIAQKYIESVSEPGSTGVDTDCTNVESCDTIVGAGNEDATRTEGTIRYDVRFDAWAPDDSGKMLLIVNIEAQNNFDPGYPLIKRAIYYASRLISAQKERYWTKSEYANINKVYTIWICLNPPQKNEGFINLYELTEKHLLGTTKLPELEYDLINVVMVGLSKSPTDNAMINMLSTVFSPQSTEDEKIAALVENEVPCEYDIKKEVAEMCNLSQSVSQNGKMEQLFATVETVMKKLGPFMAAVEFLDLPPEQIASCKRYFNIPE